MLEDSDYGRAVDWCWNVHVFSDFNDLQVLEDSDYGRAVDWCWNVHVYSDFNDL